MGDPFPDELLLAILALIFEDSFFSSLQFEQGCLLVNHRWRKIALEAQFSKVMIGGPTDLLETIIHLLPYAKKYPIKSLKIFSNSDLDSNHPSTPKQITTQIHALFEIIQTFKSLQTLWFKGNESLLQLRLPPFPNLRTLSIEYDVENPEAPWLDLRLVAPWIAQSPHLKTLDITGPIHILHHSYPLPYQVENTLSKPNLQSFHFALPNIESFKFDDFILPPNLSNLSVLNISYPKEKGIFLNKFHQEKFFNLIKENLLSLSIDSDGTVPLPHFPKLKSLIFNNVENPKNLSECIPSIHLMDSLQHLGLYNAIIPKVRGSKLSRLYKLELFGCPEENQGYSSLLGPSSNHLRYLTVVASIGEPLDILDLKLSIILTTLLPIFQDCLKDLFFVTWAGEMSGKCFQRLKTLEIIDFTIEGLEDEEIRLPLKSVPRCVEEIRIRFEEKSQIEILLLSLYEFERSIEEIENLNLKVIRIFPIHVSRVSSDEDEIYFSIRELLFDVKQKFKVHGISILTFIPDE